jgi:isopropylmalate/homocitrate/citramalate synthase
MTTAQLSERRACRFTGFARTGQRYRSRRLARATEHDVRACATSVAPATRSRVHIVLATSDIHLQHKLRWSRDEVLARGWEAVSLAKTLVHEVEFSPEDAARTDPEYLLDVLAAVIECGATTLNIPDTGEEASMLPLTVPGRNEKSASTTAEPALDPREIRTRPSHLSSALLFGLRWRRTQNQFVLRRG